MLKSTSRFEVVEVIYNKGGFAIAKGYWDGKKEKLGLGCRWHEEGGIGYPQTFGKPQWMSLPDEVKVDITNLLDPNLQELKLTFA